MKQRKPQKTNLEIALTAARTHIKQMRNVDTGVVQVDYARRARGQAQAAIRLLGPEGNKNVISEMEGIIREAENVIPKKRS